MSKTEFNLNWLPQPGETRDIPGGSMWAQSYEVRQSRDDIITGEIVINFSCSRAEFEASKEKMLNAETYRKALPV